MAEFGESASIYSYDRLTTRHSFERNDTLKICRGRHTENCADTMKLDYVFRIAVDATSEGNFAGDAEAANLVSKICHVGTITDKK